MVAAIVAFLTTFSDLGLPMATVQKRSLSGEEASTLFWAMLCFSLALTGLVAASAPAIAWFYGDRRLIAITLVVSTTFLLKGLSAQHSALLKRRLRFGAQEAVNTVSTGVGIFTAILLAWRGAGYWALVSLLVATSAVAAVGFWTACRWLPGKPGRLAPIRSQLWFGGWLTGSEILQSLSQNIDKVAIGRFCGTQQLGLYGRAYQLAMLPMQQVLFPLNSVVVPMLSRLQADADGFRRYYCRFLNVATWVTAPLSVVLAALPTEILLCTIGPQWIEASRTFALFALTGLIQPLAFSSGWIMICRGRTDRLMRWSMIRVPVLLAGILAGLPWGGEGVALAFTLCNYLLLIPCVRFAVQDSPLETAHVFQAIRRPMLLAAVVYGAMAGTRLWVAHWHPAWVIGTACLAGLAAAVMLLAVWSEARREATSLLKLAKSLGQSRRPTAEATAPEDLPCGNPAKP
jgi:PST family polysaccharide transporter